MHLILDVLQYQYKILTPHICWLILVVKDMQSLHAHGVTI